MSNTLYNTLVRGWVQLDAIPSLPPADLGAGRFAVRSSDGHPVFQDQTGGLHDLLVGGGGGGSGIAIDAFVATPGQTVFTLSTTPTSSTAMFVNGALQKPTTDYTVAGTALTWLNNGFSLNGDVVEVIY